MADATYLPKVYMTDGGDKQVVASGGELEVESGGSLSVNSDDFSLAGTGVKVLTVPIVRAKSTAEQKSGVDLPDKAVVLNVYVDVTTAEATGGTKTIDVGTDGDGSNDPDGWIDGVSVANLGLVKGTLAHGAVTLGALLKTNTGDGSAPVPDPDIASGGEEVTYTFGSNDFEELEGNIIIHYIEVA